MGGTSKSAYSIALENWLFSINTKCANTKIPIKVSADMLMEMFHDSIVIGKQVSKAIFVRSAKSIINKLGFYKIR